MISPSRITFASMLALALSAPAVQAADPGVMKAFAAAEPGMSRFVIDLPPLPDESAWKLELLVGKVVKVDAENRYFFSGSLETETIAGWGFTKHTLRELGPMAGTLMAADPSTPKIDRFVTISGQAGLLRYNSRLPVVVYVPEGVSVKYRLWRASPEFLYAPRS